MPDWAQEICADADAVFTEISVLDSTRLSDRLLRGVHSSADLVVKVLRQRKLEPGLYTYEVAMRTFLLFISANTNCRIYTLYSVEWDGFKTRTLTGYTFGNETSKSVYTDSHIKKNPDPEWVGWHTSASLHSDSQPLHWSNSSET
jgi:hypothetical protein